jgi:hypothetical protein
VRLTPSERVTEIARMLGGVRVSDAARNAAAELLGPRAINTALPSVSVVKSIAPMQATAVTEVAPQARPANPRRTPGPAAARAKTTRRPRRVA